MDSINLAGVAAVITAAAVLIAALASAYVTVRAVRTVKTTAAVADDIQTKVTQIDAAVNGKPPGATTLVSQVQDLHDQKFPEETNGDAVLPLLRRLAEDVAELKAREQ